MKSISLILLGCGGVGRQLLHHIISCRPVHAKQGVRLRVVGVSDSKSLLISPDVFTKELDDEILNEICRVKQSGSPLSTLGSGACPVFSDSQITSKLMDIAGHLGRSTGLALVDCSASVETVALLKKITDIGCCIVLANKKPLSSSLEDYDKLMSHPRRVRHEATVGAGLPIIVTVNRLLSSGDTIHRIVGSLSGTLGYVMSEVEDGKPFSQVVKTARSLGYTEPDPRDDLSGMDVARKALILARLLGQRINMDDIKVESLYPNTMGPKAISVDDFLSNGLPQLDMDIEERVMRASSNEKALRYVCVIEGSRCEVGIQELPKNSALGRSRGSDNVLEVYSRCYSEQPLVIQGAGAGNDTTAAGVLADILDMQDLFA
ncbi:hypothetical protein V2J09_006962 [Rumex salicifolius]